MERKLQYVHVKYAEYLEDNRRFPEAEAQYIKAGKPREAIDMYLHTHKWADAMRIAENHEPNSVPMVLIAEVSLFSPFLYFWLLTHVIVIILGKIVCRKERVC